MDADTSRPPGLTCSSCGAPIFFGLTPTGGRVPLNAEPVDVLELGHYAVETPSRPHTLPWAIHRAPVYLTHFATCPHAASHRKPLGGGSQPAAGAER